METIELHCPIIQFSVFKGNTRDQATMNRYSRIPLGHAVCVHIMYGLVETAYL